MVDRPADFADAGAVRLRGPLLAHLVAQFGEFCRCESAPCRLFLAPDFFALRVAVRFDRAPGLAALHISQAEEITGAGERG